MPLKVLEHHTLAVHDCKIIDLLPTKQAKQHYSADNDVECFDHLLIPGLVNAHTHSPMVFFRGLADDLPLETWLQDHIWPAEQRLLNPSFVYDGMLLAISEMLLSGTTCFNEHYFFPLQAAEACLKAGIRACIGALFIDVPTAWAKDEQDYIDKARNFIMQCPNNTLLTRSLAPHAPYTLSDPSLKGIQQLAGEYPSLGIHVHMHETAKEIEDSLQQYGKRPLQRFYDLGLLSERTLNVHMTQVNEQDIALLKKTGAHVVTCTQSNLKLASGLCPTDRLQKAGVHLAIGTDSAASNNHLDMITELKACALLAKGVSGDSTALNADQMLSIATMGGAKALGLDKQIGSLSVGKFADCVAIDFSHPNTQPCYHPVAQLIYAASSQQITDVWVAGKQLVKQRVLTTLSQQAIKEQTALWQSCVR